ncbi:MAG: hemerythrin domain-containing protein [Oculatellaceae cyanobacterium Prado106]|jgi:hemerythrin superfamily protein|nr:hemerythrin domain-containing protein [Oculatellaceae cyanobacterium Prado106]
MIASQTQNILDLIEVDHQQIEQLFDEMDADSDQAQQLEIFTQIYCAMILHSRAEELVFYPAMRDFQQTEGYIEEAEQEHNATSILLEAMLKLNPADDEFQTKYRYLKENMLNHIEEEEEEIFEAVRASMDDSALDQLGNEFQQVKLKVQPDIDAALVGYRSVS